MAREKGMGSLQLEKSGRWTVRIGINGKRISRSARTKDRDKAERFLQRMLAPLGLGDHRLPLADVWLEYVKSPNRNELAKATMESKRNVWMHFARWMEKNHPEVCDLGGVTSEAIAEYLACIRLDISASTYNNRVCVLRELFRVLAKKAGLEDDPWEGVRLRPEDSHSRRELTTDELGRLLVSARKCKGDWYMLFLVGIYTGLRLGDCCRLKWEAVNLDSEIIQLIPTKTKRHSKGRVVTIPIHPDLRNEMLQRSKDDRNGFVMKDLGEMYTKSRWQVSHELSKIFKSANITMSVKLEGRRTKTPEASFHSLRHTFVSLAANAGVPLHIVQSIVGHESTAMTRHYYHENEEALRKAVSAIPSFRTLAYSADKKINKEIPSGKNKKAEGLTPAMYEEMRRMYELLKRTFEPQSCASAGIERAEQ